MITTGSVSEEEGTTKAAPSTVQQMDIINVDADKARPGDLIEFQGLQSAAYLNGTKGYLVEFNNNEQQWAVLRFQGGKSVKAKPQNLKLLTQTASTEITHQELTCTWTLGALQQLCKLKGLSTKGKMSILIDRFLDAQLREFPAKKKPATATEQWTPTPAPIKLPKSGRICTVAGCTKQVQQGGVCCKHGAKTYRASCYIPNCTNVAKRGGLCRRHGAFKLEGCHIEGCKRVAREGTKYCNLHDEDDGLRMSQPINVTPTKKKKPTRRSQPQQSRRLRGDTWRKKADRFVHFTILFLGTRNVI